MISKELQIGKAGEHFVCADLILQGYNAFLADQGLPFDIVVEDKGKIKTVQVKATMELKTFDKATNIYRFGTRKGKLGKSRATENDVDYYAFIALDIKKIAYIPMKDMKARNGTIKQTMDFKSKEIDYKGRVYSNGTVRTPEWGKYLQDYSSF